MWQYKPYISADKKRGMIAKWSQQLEKKRATPLAPVVAQVKRGLICSTFWGRAWCENLESYQDFAHRLERGRTYARNGAILDLQIHPGKIVAHVAGSDLYEISITVTKVNDERWEALVAACTGQISSLIGLLKGELSDQILTRLVSHQHGLFPAPHEIKMTCSCPDWAGLCKHIAATLYGVGIRLETAPELFFTLRGVDQSQLWAHGKTANVDVSGGVDESIKTLDQDSLQSLFGIELDFSDVAAVPEKIPKRKLRGGTKKSAKPVGRSGASTKHKAKPKNKTLKSKPRRANE